jgi:hypothetical protein
VVLRLIASAISSTVTATTVVTVVSVSEPPVVAACRPTSTASTATPGSENEAYDHGDYDQRHNYEKHSHPNSPFTGFSHIQISVYLRALCGYTPRVVCIWFATQSAWSIGARMCVPVDRIL